MTLIDPIVVELAARLPNAMVSQRADGWINVRLGRRSAEIRPEFVRDCGFQIALRELNPAITAFLQAFSSPIS